MVEIANKCIEKLFLKIALQNVLKFQQGWLYRFWVRTFIIWIISHRYIWEAELKHSSQIFVISLILILEYLSYFYLPWVLESKHTDKKGLIMNFRPF